MCFAWSQTQNLGEKTKRKTVCISAALCSKCEQSARLPCPTFMMTFMARLLHTPPSRFSRPSTVPLEVAGVQWRVEKKEDGAQEMKRDKGMKG